MVSEHQAGNKAPNTVSTLLYCPDVYLGLCHLLGGAVQRDSAAGIRQLFPPFMCNGMFRFPISKLRSVKLVSTIRRVTPLHDCLCKCAVASRYCVPLRLDGPCSIYRPLRVQLILCRSHFVSCPYPVVPVLFFPPSASVSSLSIIV